MKTSNNKKNSSSPTPSCDSLIITALRRISDSCQNATDIDDMLHRSMVDILSIFSADRVWVLQPCELEAGHYSIKSEVNLSMWPEVIEQDAILQPDETVQKVIERCIETETPQVFNFVNDEFLNQPEAFEQFSIHTQRCIALKPEHGRPWILGLHHCTESDDFSELDIQLFTAIAHHIEAAINLFHIKSDLQQSQECFRTLIEHAPEATIVINAKGGLIIDANYSAENLFNKSRQELRATTLASLSPQDQPDGGSSILMIDDLIIEAIEGAAPSFEWSFVTAEEKVTPCKIDLVRLPSKNKVLIRGTIIDTTLQKQTEAETHKLSTVLEQVTDAVMITDENGKIEYINRSFETITGYSHRDTIGKTPSILDSGNQTANFHKTLWDTIKAGESFSNIFLNRKKDSSLYYEEKTITPLHNDKGEVTHFISTGRDISGRMEIQEHMEFLAHYDVLTNLPNRAELTNRLSREVIKAKNDESPLAVLFIDLDKFKAINDTLGHDIGDSALQRVSKLLTNCLRKDTIIARFGGDEFVIILNEIINAQEAGQIAQTILDAFAPPFMIDSHEVFISASIGVGVYPHDGNDAKSLLKHAGIAAYHAKEHGRNTFNFYNTRMSDVVDIRHDMEIRLRHALENNEFHLLYQPLVEMASGHPIGVEALIRWQPEGNHPISPLEFIPILEDTGLIVSVGEWVIKTACKQLNQWKLMGADEFRMSINLSSRQFRGNELEATLLDNIARYNIDAPDLDLEITESLLLEQSDETISMINRISKIGFNLSIDDFGTGYSSLSYLKRLPINTLKIDRAFVHDIETEDDSTTLVKAIVAMAKSLRMSIIVEGVETERQLEILKEMGCKVAQGYYFSKPLIAEELSLLLAERQIIDKR